VPSCDCQSNGDSATHELGICDEGSEAALAVQQVLRESPCLQVPFMGMQVFSGPCAKCQKKQVVLRVQEMRPLTSWAR
jgi:hypothetical protein